MIALPDLNWSSVLPAADSSDYSSDRRRSGIILAVLLALGGFAYFLVAGLISGDEARITSSRAIALVLLGGFCIYALRWSGAKPTALYALASIVSFSTIMVVIVVVSHRPLGLSSGWLELSAPLFLALSLHYFALRLEPWLALLIGGGLSGLMLFQVSLIADPGGSALHAIFYVTALNIFGFSWLCVNKRHDLIVLEDVRRLRDSDAIQRNLIVATEHELRQPLVALRTLVDSCAASSSPADIKGRLAHIADAVRMVDNTLEYLSVWGNAVGKLEDIPLSRISLADILADVAALARVESSFRGVTLEFDSCSPGLLVHSNAPALRQVLVNIVINAIRHSPGAESSDARVRIAVRQSGQRCRVFIIDNGVGISPILRKKIWSPFVKGTSVSEQPCGPGAPTATGRGLGLYLVDTTIRSMPAHSVRLRSIESRGTIFVLSVPLASETSWTDFQEPRISLGGIDSSMTPDAHRIVILCNQNQDAALGASEFLGAQGLLSTIRRRFSSEDVLSWQTAGASTVVICVDIESLMEYLSWRSSRPVEEFGSSLVVYIGVRSSEIPSAGVVVIPPHDQGYAVLLRLIEHAQSSRFS